MSDWEKICKQCGRCCFEKRIEADGTIVETETACRYLDVVTRRCKVYHKRFEVGEDCVQLTPEVVATVQWLPRSCGYVEAIGEMQKPGVKITPHACHQAVKINRRKG
ncbi:hypothetical protein [Geothermobacter hydrogeniphilus]|uniref:Uncharacterized protein n=1 Tax=Geothermobacter hydrogeniphilus TaxID=1969733 RepID=A0A1X0YDX5_9BACT|nr:hypothetical protein [Geothermobacter hydrogeniphilus]ORJ63415.1 hypothetical protein B5V00_00690 [Geothermobacter hydrogeniphilus]